LLSLGELLEEGLRGIVFERQSRLAHGHGGRLLTSLLTLEVAFESIEEESIMWNAVPVEDLLFLLCANTVVLVEEIEERALGFFERGIGARFEVAQVGEDTLFELLGILDRSTEGLKAEGEAADNVGAGDVEEVAPMQC